MIEKRLKDVSATFCRRHYATFVVEANRKTHTCAFGSQVLHKFGVAEVALFPDRNRASQLNFVAPNVLVNRPQIGKETAEVRFFDERFESFQVSSLVS